MTGNFFYKILTNISESKVCSISGIARDFGVTKEFIAMIINSLVDKGFLKIINENEYKKEPSFACKFCPFANECSERLSKIFYELSKNGKKVLESRK
ncbi:MAG: hypothetical protein ACTSUN_11415 [Promethearchaeota archaeon]